MIVVVGGGIAGLSAAHLLRKKAPSTEIVLVEQNRRLGGKLLTDHVDGFVIEGGADSFLASKPAGIDLCRELGIEQELQGTDERHRRAFVLHNGDLHAMPEGLSGLVPSRPEALRDSTLLTRSGAARLSEEPAMPKREGAEDESLAEFATRRFGREGFELLIEPLMAGIYAGDATKLSLAATFPHLRTLELQRGSVIRGVQAAQEERSPDGTRGSAFLTPIGGMQRVAEALEEQLPAARLLRGVLVKGIEEGSQGYRLELSNGEGLEAEAIVCATSAYVAANLVENLDRELAVELGTIPYASVATISVAYREADIERPLNGTGYVVPRIEGRPVLACTWVSSKFRHRAPEAEVLIRMFVGRFGAEEALEGSDQELVELAKNEADEVLGISAEPLLSRVFRWPRALPQYTMGHVDRLTRINELLGEHPGLALAGSAYRGIGVPDCVTSGRQAASRILAHIR